VIRKIFWVLFLTLLATPAYGWDEVPQPHQGGTGCASPHIIANLPTSPETGTLCYVTNGTSSAGDCSTVGTDKFLCVYSGSTWTPVGSAGTITLSGDVSGTGSSSITTTIGNDKVLEIHLKAVDAAADEECLTYETDTGDFEWQPCGGSGGNSFETMNASSGSDPVADSSTDTLDVTGTAPIVVTGDSSTDTLTISITLNHNKCIVIENPTSGDNFLFFRTESALTVTGIDCLVIGGTSVSTTLNECSADAGSCGATEAAITCATTNTTEASGVDDSAVDAGDYMMVDPGTVTGAVTQLILCVTYTQP
jgi:hypothetical protein